MSKDEVYRLIGYHGEYTESVKKSIRKLLKENHPDKNGNRKDFELINEVKKELETGTVPSKYSKKKEHHQKKESIDFEYYQNLLDKLKKKKEGLVSIKRKYDEELIHLEEEYRDIYRKNIDLELNLLTSPKDSKKIKNIKIISIIMVILSSIVFMLSVINNNFFLLTLFAILTIICVMIIKNYFQLISNISINSKSRLKDYVVYNKLIRESVQKQDEIKNKRLDISKKIILVENDIRFYENLLK